MKKLEALNTIVVLVYNKSWLTVRCLDSVLANTSPLTRNLIVIDNGSSDDTAEILKGFRQKFEAKGWVFSSEFNPQNVGFGRAVNQGARLAKTPFLTILNNDTWLMPVWDDVLLRRIEELKVTMVAPYAFEKPFNPQLIALQAAQFTRRNHGKWRPSWSSILMLFRRESFEKVGMFDEAFYLTYEDTDLRERMNRSGMSFAQVGDCFIWHHSRGTRGDQSGPSQYEMDSKKVFISKWGFDPSEREATTSERWQRRWRRFKDSWGYF
jgi:GT2 family glycosyltransferase